MRERCFEDTEALVSSVLEKGGGWCGCGGEACCYGCIANYYNQMKQAKLSRGAVRRTLGALLGR